MRNSFDFMVFETFFFVSIIKVSLENHCTRTVQSSRVGSSLRVNRIVYLAFKKGNILVNIYF